MLLDGSINLPVSVEFRNSIEKLWTNETKIHFCGRLHTPIIVILAKASARRIAKVSLSKSKKALQHEAICQ